MAGEYEGILRKAKYYMDTGQHQNAIDCFAEAWSKGMPPGKEEEVEEKCRECFHHLKQYPMLRLLRSPGATAGVALVFNVLDKRKGAAQDSGALKELLAYNSLEPHVFSNPTASFIMQTLNHWTFLGGEEALRKSDLFVCFIGAHGTQHPQKGLCMEVPGKAKESPPELLCVSSILHQFMSCEALRGKPKILLFNMCRTDVGPPQSGSKLEGQLDLGEDKDTLVVFATGAGEPANRDRGEGSFFVQALGTVLRAQRRGHILVEDLLVRDLNKELQRLHGRKGTQKAESQNSLGGKDLYWPRQRLGRDAAVPRRGTNNLRVRQNPHFRGREAEMETVRSLLEDPGNGIVCIWAMAGMGKTQLMVEYAHKHLQHYDRVLWVDGGPQPVLRANFASLAHDPLALPLPVGQGEDGKELAQKEVRRFLEGTEDICLLLLDNVDEEGDVFPLVPASGNSHVIITTKKKEGLQNWPSLELKELTEADAWALVSRGREFPEDQARALRCLCTELANHTLALAVAAGILAKGAMKPSVLLSQLQARGEWSGGAIDPGFNRPARLQALFDESLAAMERGGSERGWSEQALALAKKMALAGGWFAPTAIRIPLLVSAVKKAGCEGREEDLLGFADEAVALLVEYSLAVANEKGVQFHRLVGNYMRHRAPDLGRAAAKAVADVGVVAADVEHFRVVWERFAEKSHPQELVLETVDQVGQQLARYMGVEMCQFEEAERVLGKCFEFTARRNTRDMDLLSLRLQNTKGAILFRQGRYKDAEDKLRAVLAVRERLQGSEHPSTLCTRDNLAVAAQKQGRHAEAEGEYRAVLAVMERVLGAEHPDTLWTRSSLANTAADQGRYAEAEGEYRAVLAVRERVLGAEHPGTLWTRNGLARAVESQGRYAEAEEEYRAVLAVRERVLGAEHPDTLFTRNDLADAAQSQGRHAEAEGEYRAVLAGRERVLGAEHPDTLMSRLRLADIILKQVGRGSSVASAEDIPLLLADVNKALPLLPASKDVARALNFLAWRIQAVDGTQHLQQAETFARRSVEIRRTVCPSFTANALDTLAAVLHKQGKTGEALMFAREAVGLASEEGSPYSEGMAEEFRATLCIIEAEASLSEGREG